MFLPPSSSTSSPCRTSSTHPPRRTSCTTSSSAAAACTSTTASPTVTYAGRPRGCTTTNSVYRLSLYARPPHVATARSPGQSPPTHIAADARDHLTVPTAGYHAWIREKPPPHTEPRSRHATRCLGRHVRSAPVTPSLASSCWTCHLYGRHIRKPVAPRRVTPVTCQVHGPIDTYPFARP